MAANPRATYSLACQCVFVQYVTISAFLLGNRCGASSLILSDGMFKAPGRCAPRLKAKLDRKDAIKVVEMLAPER
jgi:hypothetical protein